MKVGNIYICLIVLIGFSCSVSNKSVLSEEELSLLNTRYYSLFIDATKHALFGNDKSALNMYNACIYIFPEKAASYYQISSIYLRENNIAKAREYAINAVNLNDSNIWYKYNLANIYQYENNYESAAALYEEIIKEKNNLKTKYNLALLYSEMDMDEKAIELLEEIENENRGNKNLFLMKHNIYHNMGDYDSAVIELESMIKYFPDDLSNYGILAEYLAELGRNNYAIEVYTDLIRQDSLNGLALLSYADFFMKNNKPDSAFVYYGKTICCSNFSFEEKLSIVVNYISNKMLFEKFSKEIIGLLDIMKVSYKDYRVYASYTDIYINLQQYENAVPYLDSALIFEKNNLLLWEQSILVNNYLGNSENVVKVAEEAIKYFPDKGNFYVIKAYSERELDNNDIAIIDIDIALDLNLENDLKIQSYNLLAEIYRERKFHSKSDSCFELILAIDPENLMIRNNYAYYLSLRNVKLDYARDLSKLTVIREPLNATYLDTYGWILFVNGEIKEAKRFIESAIRNGAYNNSEVLDHYGQVMLGLKKCTEAIEAWEKILEIDSEYDIEDRLKSVKENCK